MNILIKMEEIIISCDLDLTMGKNKCIKNSFLAESKYLQKGICTVFSYSFSILIINS
jgi:hypothetical protein